ncbi:TadE/TadG family type IV pilus assembly protein [Geodermatophilus sp. URMC 64]
MWQRLREQRGASAVEFALIVPLLIVLVIGIAEFGRAFQVQSTLSAAAREGVRTMALQNDQAKTRAMVRSVASSLDPALTDAQIAISPASCPLVYTPGASVRVTITYRHPFFTDFFGSGVQLTGTGVMRCNG